MFKLYVRNEIKIKNGALTNNGSSRLSNRDDSDPSSTLVGDLGCVGLVPKSIDQIMVVGGHRHQLGLFSNVVQHSLRVRPIFRAISALV